MALRVTKTTLEVAGKLGVLAPLEAGYLPELLDFFMQNWSAAVSIEAAWSTDVTAPFSLSEERRGLVDRPYRRITTHWTGLRRGESARMFQAMLRSLHQRLLLPFYPDKTKSTAPTSGAVITCDPTYRRFFPGGRAIIHDWEDQRPANAEIFAIESVSSTTITATGPLGSHPAGARVMPLIETEIELDARSQLLSNEITDFSLAFDEVVGPGALNPWLPPWDNPPLPTYRQIPIMTLRPDWAAGVSAFARRSGEKEQDGRAPNVSISGDRPRVGYEWTFTGTSRARAWEILRFVDSRRGRLRAFWMVSPQTMWTAAAVSTTAIEIQPVSSIADMRRFFEWIAVRFSDGTILVRGIVDVVPTGTGTWSIEFSEPIPSTLANISLVRETTAAHLVRFDRDDYTEEWTTDEFLAVKCRAFELVHDRAVKIENFDAPIPIRNPDAVPDVHLWLESPANMRTPMGAPVAASGDEVERWADVRAGIARELRTTIPPLEGRHAYYASATLNLRARNYPAAMPFVKGELWTDPVEPIFSNALGMTVFVAMQRRETETYPSGDDRIVAYLDDLGAADGLYWSPTLVQFWEDAGRLSADFRIETPDILYPRAVPHVLCLTWKPGFYARVYADGYMRGEAPRAVVDLPIFTGDRGRARFFRFANNALDASSDDDTWFDSMAVYRRALTIDELNIVGQYFAGLVGTNWRKVV